MGTSYKVLGFNLYKDENDRTIYYDNISKKAYLLTSKEEKKFFLFSSRPIIGFIVAYIIYYLIKEYIIAIFAGVMVYLVLLFFFRKMFLADLSVINGFVPNKCDSLVKRLGESFSKGRIISIIVVSFVLAILSIYNANYSNYEGLVKYLNYVLSLGSTIFGILYIFVLINKDKN
jgi:branched-subunit amino acid transport protein AzlD